jgi:hypothetical protein
MGKLGSLVKLARGRLSRDEVLEGLSVAGIEAQDPQAVAVDKVPEALADLMQSAQAAGGIFAVVKVQMVAKGVPIHGLLIASNPPPEALADLAAFLGAMVVPNGSDEHSA